MCNVYPCIPKFYYIKVGFKGVKIILARFRDGFPHMPADLAAWCDLLVILTSSNTDPYYH